MVFLVEIFNGDGELTFNAILESEYSSGEIQRELEEFVGDSYWDGEDYEISVTFQDPISMSQLKDRLKDEIMDKPIPRKPDELEVPTPVLTQKCVCGCLFLAHMAHKREADGTYVASSCENHSEYDGFAAA